MGLSKQRYLHKFKAILYFYKEEQWNIAWMCRTLEVSKAGYYKWLHRTESEAERKNQQLAALIQEYDERFNHILGYRRMTSWINHFNHTHYKRKHVQHIMQKLGIKAIIRPKKKKYASSSPETTAENLLGRNFNASRPNEKWATDVTEFKWYEGVETRKLYLSAIIDLYDRSIVAHMVSRRNDNKLVFDTFDKAIAANPDAHPLFHSDRGFQYTSKVFQMKLQEQNMTQSMSRVGRCIDNAPTEGFWGIVKAEMFYLQNFHDETSLRSAIEQYILFYNTMRLQERYGNKAPLEVRAEALATVTPAQYPIAENKRIQAYKAKFAA